VPFVLDLVIDPCLLLFLLLGLRLELVLILLAY
jgi:hypothetical protein